MTDTSGFAHLTASELIGAYRVAQASPVEVTKAALERIGACDHDVNAFCLVDADRALEAAQASERRYHAGEPAGLLDGVPVGVKDVFVTAGWATLRGSTTIDPAGPWEHDAPVVAAMRRHGAVLLGKTTTPEFGWKAVTDSPRHGVTRNPWDLSRTPGGSTGGTAAAIALGITPLGPGTDGGGSIRIPCSFCGLVGLKPTFGRVPLWPPSPFGTLAHAGPMSRTVEDSARLLTVLAEPDPRDPLALAPDGHDYRDDLEAGVAGLRIAYSRDLGHLDVDAEVTAAVDATARGVADLGAVVEEVDPGFDDPTGIWAVLWYAGAANALRDLERSRRDELDPGLRRIADEAAAYSAVDYLAAVARRGELGVRMGEFHETYDLLLTPTVAVVPFGAGRDVPDGWSSDRWESWAGFSLPFNLTQQPAASVPCGVTSDGLPIGAQIVGPRYSDALVLRAASVVEQASPLAGRYPPEPRGEQ